MYRLENAAGLQACALAARLCSDRNLDLGEETCEHTSDTSDQDSCVLEIACTSPIDLGANADAQAWRLRVGGANCNRWAPGTSFACACQTGSVTNRYSLLADNGELACGPLADFCLTGATPVFEGDEACLLSSPFSDSNGCYVGAECGPQQPLTDEVSLVKLEQRSASCTPRAGGGSECGCSNNDAAFLFQLSTPPNDASCESAIPNCDPKAVIEPTGTASCKLQSPDASEGDRCQIALDCVQSATVDGRSIVAQGTMAVICARAASGKPWACTFSSGPETGRIELGAVGASASQACAQGSTAVLNGPGLYLGLAGDLMVPPEP